VHDDEDPDDFFQFDGALDGDDAATLPDDAPLPVPPRLGLLASLSHAEFDVVARSAKLAHIEAGTVVFHQGDEADRFFILVDGHVSLERDGAPLAELGPGSFFGESALLVRGRRSATVTATEPCSLWSVDYDTFGGGVSGHLLDHETAGDEVRARLDQARPEHFR
jgi:CRP-like cAMP-binding protein